MSEIEVKRFAIKYDPPTLVVEYKKYNKDSQIWKTFLKKIRIKNPEESNSEELCEKLIKKHLDVLGPEKVCKDQILDLLNLLLSSANSQDNENDDIDRNIIDNNEIKNNEIKNNNNNNNNRSNSNVRIDDVINNKKIDDLINNINEESLNLSFESENSFMKDPMENNIEEMEKNVSSGPTTIFYGKKPSNINKDVLDDNNNLNNVFKIAEKYSIDGDLNKVSEAQNLRAKQEMNVEFEKNRLKPTDKDFVYDIKVDFEAPTEVAEWDESDNEDD